MSKRLTWFERVALGGLVLLGAAYFALASMLPGWISRQIQRATNHTVTVERVWLEFPLNVVLSGVRLDTGRPETAITSDRIVITPQWISWDGHTTWIRSLRIINPRLRLSRSAEGTLRWPAFDRFFTTAVPSSPSAAPTTPIVPWRFVIQTVRLSGGTVEWVDELPPQPFRAQVDDLALVAGPLQIPFQPGHVFVVVQGRLTHEPHAAPVSCSGWADLQRQDVDVSCRLDPLALAVFEPYYQGPLQIHAYDATLTATAHLTAKANAMDGRIQLELGNLTEGDVSRGGRTVADIKKIVPEGGPAALTGEIKITGPLTQLADWQCTLVPGNDIVQRLIKPLLDRRIQRIQVKVGDATIPVGLTPASPADMSDIAAGTEHVKEALEIIAPTAKPAATPPPATAPTPPPPAAPSSTMPQAPPAPAAPVATPAPVAPAQPPQGSAAPVTPPASSETKPSPPASPVPASSAAPAAPPQTTSRGRDWSSQRRFARRDAIR